ncbi:hypothetical protein GE061_012228 [Apolygus lucorum]|uniref:MADF domain-containing protein n=1 Tax=Apolygus lucorum TaxID=248454 RepID=A0A8S9XSX3_APOLU|nr:hypothetical protein GE061_012228 [Apolygus lucorum]
MLDGLVELVIPKHHLSPIVNCTKLKSEPCPWQVKNKYYHDWNKREAAYTKLVSKLREIKPDATRDTVVKRLNNMRSAMRKEKKKSRFVQKSDISGRVSSFPHRLYGWCGDSIWLQQTSQNILKEFLSGYPERVYPAFQI